MILFTSFFWKKLTKNQKIVIFKCNQYIQPQNQIKNLFYAICNVYNIQLFNIFSLLKIWALNIYYIFHYKKISLFLEYYIFFNMRTKVPQRTDKLYYEEIIKSIAAIKEIYLKKISLIFHEFFQKFKHRIIVLSVTSELWFFCVIKERFLFFERIVLTLISDCKKLHF